MRFQVKGKYKYRNLACTDSPYGWNISGQDVVGNSGGILEWCYDQQDAADRLNQMSQSREFKNSENMP